MELTKEQESKVIDFLKRWGIDSPELLVEMTDHYCEIATESMSRGISFEKTLDSWKTKKNYLNLRQVQSEYESAFRKQWLRAHLKAFKRVFLSGQFFILALISGLVYTGFKGGFGVWLSGIFVVKAIALTAFFLYLITNRGRYGKMMELRRTAVFWFGNYILLFHFISSGGLNWEIPYMASPWLICISVIFDFAAFNLWKEIQKTFQDIMDEYFVEPQIPPSL